LISLLKKSYMVTRLLYVDNSILTLELAVSIRNNLVTL
jgi:hypothetical protein